MFFYLVELIGIEPTTIGLWARPKYQKNIPRCGCFFHPDRPSVIYQLEIGKVVEKADVKA